MDQLAGGGGATGGMGTMGGDASRSGGALSSLSGSPAGDDIGGLMGGGIGTAPAGGAAIDAGTSPDLASRLAAAGKMLGAVGNVGGSGPGEIGPGPGSNARGMGPMPGLSSLDNLIRILERQKAMGAQRREARPMGM